MSGAAPGRRALALAFVGLAACGGGGPGPGDAGPPDGGPPVCPEVEPPTPPFGDCRSIDDCPTGAVCALEATESLNDLAEAPGRCADPTGGAAPGAACEAPADCASGACAWAGTCLALCGTSADCGGVDVGARCRSLPVRRAGGGAVVARVCVPGPSLPPGPRVDREVRPAALRGSLAGEPVWLPPLGASGASIVGLAVVEDRCGGRLVPRALAGADRPDVLLFDADAVGIGTPPFPNPVEATVPLVVHVPAGPDAATSAVGYVLDVTAEARADLDVTTVVWSPPAPGTPRQLDLDLFYVGPEGLAPAGARGPPAIAAALARAETVLAPAGLSFGEVRQHLVNGRLADELGVIDAGQGGRTPELERLLALSAGPRGPALAVFFVRAFARGEVGLAGGIPAPLGLSGTPGSGLALAHDVLVGGGAGDVDLGRALAHELGHAFGLFHTTEAVGVVLDPLPDTPSCPPTLDGSAGTPADGVLDARECTGFGADHLMFHAASGERLSPSQAAILNRTPLATP